MRGKSNRQLLTQSITQRFQKKLTPRLERGIMNYLSDRQSSLLFRDQKLKRIKQGIPQGGVFSSVLFNYYISKLSQPPKGSSITSYADKCTRLTSGNEIDDMSMQGAEYSPLLNPQQPYSRAGRRSIDWTSTNQSMTLKFRLSTTLNEMLLASY